MVCFPYSIENDTVYIDKKTADKIEPELKKWLYFYSLNIMKFYYSANGGCFSQDPLENDTTSMYYRAYTISNDIYDPQLYDYSPDKTRYVNLLSSTGVYREDDGKCYYMGGDDCQEIYLTDRKKKGNYMIIWNGAGSFSEAVFWVNNDVFIVAGQRMEQMPGDTFVFHLIDLNKKDCKYFEYHTSKEDVMLYYFNEINLKEREIIEPNYE